MKYIEATTITKPINEKVPVVINAAGKRLVIRANIHMEDADLTIIADEIFQDYSRIDVTTSGKSVKPMLYLLAKEQIRVYTISAIELRATCVGGSMTFEGKPIMAHLRANLPSHVETFFRLNAQKPTYSNELELHLNNCSDSKVKIYKLNSDGINKFKSNEYYRAIKEYSKAIELATTSQSTISTSELATIFFNRGRAHQQNESFEEAIWDYKKVIKMHNKHAKAESYLKDAIKDFLLHYEGFKLQDLSSPDVATNLNNAGLVCESLGQYTQARKYGLAALAMRKKLLGQEHPDTATSLNNVGMVFHKLGNDELALRYLIKALEIQKKLFGEEHPDIATTLNNIGDVYDGLGEHELALQQHQEALAIRKKLLGEQLGNSNPEVLAELPLNQQNGSDNQMTVKTETATLVISEQDKAIIKESIIKGVGKYLVNSTLVSLPLYLNLNDMLVLKIEGVNKGNKTIGYQYGEHKKEASERYIQFKKIIGEIILEIEENFYDFFQESEKPYKQPSYYSEGESDDSSSSSDDSSWYSLKEGNDSDDSSSSCYSAKEGNDSDDSSSSCYSAKEDEDSNWGDDSDEGFYDFFQESENSYDPYADVESSDVAILGCSSIN